MEVIIVVTSSFIVTTCSSNNTAEQNLYILIREPNKQGVVQSPNFPNPFPANIHCKWHFIAPSRHNIKLFMETLNIDAKSQCLVEPYYLYMYDGLSTKDDELLSATVCRYSSYQALKPSFYVFSAGTRFLVEFKSGSDTPTGYGFSANYTFQSLGE